MNKKVYLQPMMAENIVRMDSMILTASPGAKLDKNRNVGAGDIESRRSNGGFWDDED